ncbi:hypothetical protein A1O1_02258 [Capronia coronata CBS 617.96]|uniref:Conserved oligomeric Golgi complex subunit 2 n=1 Tax=Capronia coronata CBS 617.96 TaxID=1182541 RepID=W9YW38_9EURO|nr:uncharacterized protein A1O1_02258 [Capronia coronata CBS 617.96]EXJ93865.1 hypothetical protein A1O1_02258 [Capronia coronata CBS 617.96]
MSSRFYFGGSDSGSEVDEDAPLPFPKPIDRSAFLAPDFDPTTFLSGLSHRFQTLEDLQAELRELSHSLNKELVDLVNDNYQEFLSLGSTLSGGGEKIEDIRVGLLGFQRDIKAVRDKVDERRNEVIELLKEKRALKQQVAVGRALLEIAERLDQLEEKLNISNERATNPQEGKVQAEEGLQFGEQWMDTAGDESDDEYDSEEDLELPPRLRRRIEDYLILKHLVGRHSPHHPFILAQEARVRKIQEVLLSDLDIAIKQEPEVKTKQQMLQVRAAVEN